MTRSSHMRCSGPGHPPLGISLPFLVMGILLSPAPSAGQTQSPPPTGGNIPTLTWQGEVRPRLYGQEPVGDGWDHWVSMRTRLGLDARLQSGLGLFLQIQDVRFWGEEVTHRDRSGDAVDFHQAYLEVDSIPVVGGLVRVGRQEVSLAEGRFLAAPDWGQAGQSFDGILWTKPTEDVRFDLVYLRLREGSSEAHDHDADLTAAWLSLPMDGIGSVDLLAIHDRSGETERTGQSTVGSILKKTLGDVSLRVQGMYQFGEREGTQLSAYMLAARGTLAFMEGKGSVTLWYDHLSGDADPGDDELRTFSTLFGSRHRYYGRADYFLDIPEDTGGLGLRDAALKVALSPTPLLTLNLDLHAFRTAEPGTLSSRNLAKEADLWIRHRYREGLTLEVGYSLTWAGTAMEELGRLEGTGNAGYFMTSVQF